MVLERLAYGAIELTNAGTALTGGLRIRDASVDFWIMTRGMYTIQHRLEPQWIYNQLLSKGLPREIFPR